jgi:hypothetical protein
VAVDARQVFRIVVEERVAEISRDLTVNWTASGNCAKKAALDVVNDWCHDVAYSTPSQQQLLQVL